VWLALDLDMRPGKCKFVKDKALAANTKGAIYDMGNAPGLSAARHPLVIQGIHSADGIEVDGKSAALVAQACSNALLIFLEVRTDVTRMSSE
jgi:hypothetical protein